MNKIWEPTFDDWFEGKVSLSPCELTTHSSSRNECGVMMQVEDAQESCPEGAAIFWTDEMHLYLRYDWGQWYNVSNDDPENCANICKRNTATLLLCTMSSIKHHAVRVYHIDKLPEELFGRQTDDVPNSDKVAQLDLDLEDSQPPVLNCKDDDDESPSLQPPLIKETFPDDTNYEKEIEKEVGEHLEATEEAYAEIKDAVDQEVERYNGQVLVRYRPGNARLYSYDVIEIKHRLLVIVYGELKDDWLADEESFNDETPLWFSESDHRGSPVFQAMKCRDFFRSELPNTNIDSLVVLPKGCVVINDDEMQKTWRENCGTEMVRTTQIDETTILTLREYLASLSTIASENPELDAADLASIASRFSTDPENWIIKE